MILKINSETRSGWLVIALVAVLLQALVPAGYMPDFSAAHSGGLMPLRICTGDGFTTLLVSKDRYGISRHSKDHHNPTVCDYAVNHVFGFMGGFAPFFTALLLTLFFIFNISELMISRRTDFGTMAARAPPIFS